MALDQSFLTKMLGTWYGPVGTANLSILWTQIGYLKSTFLWF